MASKEDLILDALKEIKEELMKVVTSVVKLETREELHRQEVQDLHKDMKLVLEEKIPAVRTDITTLKTKATIWGAVAGAVIAFIATVALKLGDIILR